jgi:hypothetical protein
MSLTEGTAKHPLRHRGKGGLSSDSNADSNTQRHQITRGTLPWFDPRRCSLLGRPNTPETATYRIRNQQVAGSIPAGGSINPHRNSNLRLLRFKGLQVVSHAVSHQIPYVRFFGRLEE